MRILTTILIVFFAAVSCQDLDNCPSDVSCPPNAHCVNRPGIGITCECNRGYTGDGLNCILTTGYCESDLSCGENAECELKANPPFCKCKKGYFGDGYLCKRTSENHCQLDSNGIQYCECESGYQFNGQNCEKIPTTDLNHDCFLQPDRCSPFAKCVGSRAMDTNDPTAYGAGHCKCREGFTGNGLVCKPMSECFKTSDCPPRAECVATKSESTDSTLYKCNCTEGLVLIPSRKMKGKKECVEFDKAPCNLFKNCHINATCKATAEGHTCKCKPGFRGDGKICLRSDIPCNILDTCGRHAVCDYNPKELGFRCMCKREYQGDGYSCSPISSCREFAQQCHSDAECVYSPLSQNYQCICNPGFFGDGYECEPANRYEGIYLVYAHGMSIFRIPTLPEREDEMLISYPDRFPIGIDVDCAKNSIFFSDIIAKSICKSTLNSSQETVIHEDLHSPEGVAVDWLARNIYWTDAVERKIKVSKINGSWEKVLFDDNLLNPRGIVVHPGLGLMYWTDWNRNNPKIEMANMDGTGRKILVKDNIRLPNMLAIDYKRNELCWTDAGLKRIECIDLFGVKRRLVQHTGGHPFGIAIAEDYIFWTDWEANKIYRIQRNGGEIEALKTSPGINGKLHGIIAMPTQCPPMGNPCMTNNGGCNYLCLPNGRQGVTCACPPGVQDVTCDNFGYNNNNNNMNRNTNDYSMMIP